jgi:hypothetical protein
MGLNNYFKKRAELEARKYLTENRKEWANRTGNRGFDAFDNRIGMDTERDLSELDEQAAREEW